MSTETREYQDCLKDQAFYPKDIVRISLNSKINDPDLELEVDNNPYLLDQTKILQSKAIRRAANKTQVFFDPDNPHVRTRLVHTFEVVGTGSSVGSLLGLNTELIRSQTLGHDIGHAPAGHLFEQITQELGLPKFRHEHFSAIVAAFIERNGDGLNLTRETLMGIYEHSRGNSALQTNQTSIQESLVTMYSDKIAYITADFNDLKRHGIISNADIQTVNTLFPGIQRDKTNQCVQALCQETQQAGRVSFFESETAQKFSQVKDIMYGYYTQLNRASLSEKIKTAYDSLDKIPELGKYDKTILMALMTDRELSHLDDISCNRRPKLDDLTEFGIFEIIKKGFLEGQTYTDLDLRLSRLVYNHQS